MYCEEAMTHARQHGYRGAFRRGSRGSPGWSSTNDVIRRFPEEPGQTIARLEDDETVDWDA